MSKKPVIVLHRMIPRQGKCDAVRALMEEWFVFLKEKSECKSMETLCCIDEQVAWIEEWPSKAVLDAFNEEHLSMSDFISRMVSVSKIIPSRLACQVL